MGEKSLEVTILEINDGIFKERAIAVDLNFGGNEFDNSILKYCIKEFDEEVKVDITKNYRAKQRLLIACQQA